MKAGITTALLATAIVGVFGAAEAQAPRKDAIWARTTFAPITLNGVLSEPGWAVAESMVIRYAQDTGVPGSGWKSEGGVNPANPTHATLKFLVEGNYLYLGARIRDTSIGGSKDFNRFDGLLMGLKDHASDGAPKPVSEYMYAWWNPLSVDPQPVGQMPAFIGRWATWPPYTARTPEQIANWNAVTVLQGQSNTDIGTDTQYTIEMRFNLTPMGYDVTTPHGDIIEWNVSVYDCDNFWPLNAGTFSSNRVWWQGPWGNDVHYNQVRIWANPSVNTGSGPVPTIMPEVVVPNAAGYALPTINGTLTEPVWADIPGIDIRYGDAALRQTYAGVGPFRAGQYQPPVNGGTAAVLDPGDATVKMFHEGDFLYLGFDVRDQVVQYHPSFDRWDGFLVSINDRGAVGPDNNLIGRRISFQVGPTGAVQDHDYLSTLILDGGASVATALKPGTTVDTLGLSADVGYTAELRIDLKKLGYPAGLGDRALFIGVNLLDGDSFTPFTDSYGTRTWWNREYEGTCCPSWTHLSTTQLVSGVEDGIPAPALEMARSYPNPSTHPTLSYALSEASDVTLEVFDVQGRRIERRALGVQPIGAQELSYDGSGLEAGLYLYRLIVLDPQSGAARQEIQGRMVIVP